MSDLLENIPECTPNGTSLLSAEYANKIIRAVNAMKNMIINPTQNVGFVTHTQSQFVLDLSKVDSRLSALEALVTSTPASGNTNANTSILGNVSDLQATTTNLIGDIFNSQSDISNIQSRMN